MRTFLGVAIVVCAGALCASATAATVKPVTFAPKAGWYTGVGKAHACPGVAASTCSRVTSWASTVRWRDCVDCLPHRTVAALAPGGIAIQISVIHETPPVAKETISWPPRVKVSDLVSPYEGLPSRIGVYQRFVRTGAHELYILVLFGRNRPDARQLALANAQLRSATVP
jgi:hypothetical protein